MPKRTPGTPSKKAANAPFAKFAENTASPVASSSSSPKPWAGRTSSPRVSREEPRDPHDAFLLPRTSEQTHHRRLRTLLADFVRETTEWEEVHTLDGIKWASDAKQTWEEMARYVARLTQPPAAPGKCTRRCATRWYGRRKAAREPDSPATEPRAEHGAAAQDGRAPCTSTFSPEKTRSAHHGAVRYGHGPPDRDGRRRARERGVCRPDVGDVDDGPVRYAPTLTQSWRSARSHSSMRSRRPRLPRSCRAFATRATTRRCLPRNARRSRSLCVYLTYIHLGCLAQPLRLARTRVSRPASAAISSSTSARPKSGAGRSPIGRKSGKTKK